MPIKMKTPSSIKILKSLYTRSSNPIKKINYLFKIHNSSPNFQKNKDSLEGILDMVDGLEYHLKKIKNYEKIAYLRVKELDELREQLYNGKKVNFEDSKYKRYTNASHEAVGYINRLGQIYYFFTSKWFKTIVNEKKIAKKIPTILALTPIRNKHTAHRQQDYPSHGDCDLGFNNHKLFPGLMFSNNQRDASSFYIEFQFPTNQRHSLLKKYNPNDAIQGIECLGSENNIIRFAPTKVHQVIIGETTNLLESFF